MKKKEKKSVQWQQQQLVVRPLPSQHPLHNLASRQGFFVFFCVCVCSVCRWGQKSVSLDHQASEKAFKHFIWISPL